MIEKITSDNGNRGQVGIGTLIIFIALVLVAAIGASVLINTAGLLQSQAQDTGDEARQQVSNQIDVVSKVGKVNTNQNGISAIDLTVKKSAGSNDIDLNESTVIFTSSAASSTVDVGNNSSVELTGIGDASAPVLSDASDRVSMNITVSDLNGGSDLSEGESATIRLVDQSGSETTVGVNVPNVLDGKSYVTL